MASNVPKPSVALRRLSNGYQVSQAIHVAATLGLADLLKDGARSSDELAAATGTHAPSLYRLLRALAGVGVFREEADRRFAPTPLGECLRFDAPEPVGGWAAFIGESYHWQAWSQLLYSIQTGESAFRHVHGMDSWSYRARHPELSATFDRAMTDSSRQVAQAVLAAYDFGQFARLVDVGGGQGAFLAAVLAQCPGVQGVLFDQPHVVAGADRVLQAAGVADRCRVVGGSFFESVPDGGDGYMLKAVLHDWDDEPAVAILRSCRRAMPAQGKLLVIERSIEGPNEDPDGKFSDLNMLVSLGGRERTGHEYATLFAAADFQLAGATRTEIEISVIEATPV